MTDRWLRARVDAVFLPRTLIRVERLPRSDNGKLQRQALDRVYAEWKAGSATRTGGFTFIVPADHPALPGHFPGRAIVPGVLLLDEALRGIGRALGASPAAAPKSLQQVKFAAPLLPEETAQVTFERDGQRLRFSVTTQRGGSAVLLASGSVVLAGGEPKP